MANVNHTILVGNLGGDPNLYYTKEGQAVANFSIATNRHFKTSDGKPQKRTEWHAITVWGKQAENCHKYLSKGHEVFVEGRLETRCYTDKEGIARKVTGIVAQNVQFLGRHGPEDNNKQLQFGEQNKTSTEDNQSLTEADL